MDAKMLTKMVIVGTIFFILVVVGAKSAKWASDTSKVCEGRYQEAVRVLQEGN